MRRAFSILSTLVFLAASAASAQPRPSVPALSRPAVALPAAKLPAVALPVDAAAPPAQLTRTLRTFDFEERARGNVEDIPLGWLKVEGPGLPRYIGGQLDTVAPAASGTGSFRFTLNGGSVSYRFPGTRTPTMLNARYRISTKVRTTDLRYARAQLTAYFCDARGRPIAGTVRHSAGFVSDPADGDRFRTLSFDLTADDPESASLVVELGLLQPALLGDAPAALDEVQKLAEDIRGSAWFDDVRIAQIPDFTLRTDRPTNVFARGEPVNLRVRVSDRLTADLTAEIRLTDANGRSVYQRTGSLTFAEANAATTRDRIGTIPLPQLPAGWYEARLTLRSQGQYVDDRSLAIVQLGDAMRPTRPDPRFGVIATDLPPATWPLLPPALDSLATGRVKLSVWSNRYTVDGPDPSALIFDRLIDALAERDIALTACLSGLPPEVRKSVGGDLWTDVAKVGTEQWQPQLGFLLARHAGLQTSWQFMDDAQADRFAREPAYRAVFERVAGEYRKLIGNADLAMPWPAWFELGKEPLPESVALRIPADVLPEQIPLYLADLTSDAKRQIGVALAPIDRERYGRDPQRADFALRIAYALAGGAARIDLPLPMKVTEAEDEGDEAVAEPDELLIAQRVIVSQMSNAQYAGIVRLAPGIDAFLFNRDGSGVMLIWTHGDALANSQRRTSLTLGEKATLVELDGKVTPLTPGSGGKRDEFDVPVGPMPVFITDVDAELLRLRASIKIDNPLLESTAGQHARSLTFTNTFDGPISGTIRLTSPAGWTVATPLTSFSLSPGETFRMPLTITLPATTPAGDRTVLADLRVTGRSERRLAVPLALKLGLSDVGLNSLAIRDGDEVIVQQTITNYGRAPISYTTFAMMPGQARQERMVNNLAPGKSTIRKFRFAAPAPGVAKLRSGLRQMEGKRMLNEDVVIPE